MNFWKVSLVFGFLFSNSNISKVSRSDKIINFPNWFYCLKDENDDEDVGQIFWETGGFIKHQSKAPNSAHIHKFHFN